MDILAPFVDVKKMVEVKGHLKLMNPNLSHLILQ